MSPLVQYATADQIASGIWGADATWWDDGVGYQIFSNRWMIPVIIVSFLATAYGSMFTFFFAYNWWWCIGWEGNLGNSKYSFCKQPAPNSLN